MNKYLVFEGTDGSGKTSISNAIYEWLPEPKIKTKEPGSPHIPLCKQIREEILHNASQSKDPLLYAYLFAADTKLHMEKVVKPHLEAGSWVVSDRSVLSDFAYRPSQGDNVREHNLHNFVRQGPLVFFVDADPNVCAERMRQRGNLNEFEKAHVLNKIREIRTHYLHTSFKRYHGILGKLGLEKQSMWYNIDNNSELEVSITQTMATIVSHFPELHYLLQIGKELK